MRSKRSSDQNLNELLEHSITKEGSLSSRPVEGDYGSYNLNSGTTLDLAFEAGGTVENSITGDGDLTISAGETATVTLKGQNSYTGSTTVYSGTMVLDSSASLASDELILYSNTTFKPNDSYQVKGLTVYAHTGSAAYDGDLSMTEGNIDFYGSLDNNNHTLLKVTGDVSVTNITYSVYLDGSTKLQEDTTFTLIEAGTGKSVSFQGTLNNFRVGSTVEYETVGYSTNITNESSFVFSPQDVLDYINSKDEDEENNTGESGSQGGGTSSGQGGSSTPGLSIGKGHARDEAKVLLEGRLSGLSMVNAGADLAAEAGMSAMVKAVKDNQYSITPFMTVQGSSLRYDTGSYIDLQSLSFMAGIAAGKAVNDNSDMTLGLYAEFGDASYDTHNSFNGENYNGSGSANYSAAGAMMRYGYRISEALEAYGEGSVRFGHLHNSYHNNHLVYDDKIASYKTSSDFFGFHLGAGIILDVTDSVSLDLNAKYLYTKIEDEDTTLSTGESLYFDDLESKRLRFSGLLTFTLNSHTDLLAGLAYEREYDGKARGTTNGYDIASPKLEGHTGIGRLGLSIRPNPQVPLTLEFNLNGYAGQREGITGSGMVKYEF